MVTQMPALVCSKCGAVSVDGRVLDEIAHRVAAVVLADSELEPDSIRFLRKILGDTQEELAVRLGVTRATVNRWEKKGAEPVAGPDAYAIRSHAFFRLRDRSAAVEKVAPVFTEAPKKHRKRRSYAIEGEGLPLSA
ncbi:MAG: helix-turn-helix domain-containing protein [Polyangiales bacterium]